MPVFPDCWDAVQFFRALTPGCWNVGVNGPTGLRPEAFAELRFAHRIKPRVWRRIYPDVCVMELAAIEAMRKQ